MDVETIIIWAILLFAIIYFSVRLAINPLLHKSGKIIIENQEPGLVKLRDIGILSNDELEEVIQLYKNKGVREKDYQQYNKYAKVLSELKEIKYLDEEKYFNKMGKLKEFFKVE